MTRDWIISVTRSLLKMDIILVYFVFDIQIPSQGHLLFLCSMVLWVRASIGYLTVTNHQRFTSQERATMSGLETIEEQNMQEVTKHLIQIRTKSIGNSVFKTWVNTIFQQLSTSSVVRRVRKKLHI